LTRKEAAARLGISTATLDNYAKALFLKMRVQSNMQMAAKITLGDF
jgi:DNA-binding NarL/FixJ family response regulator